MFVLFPNGLLSFQSCWSQNKRSTNTCWNNKLPSCLFLFFVGYRHPSPAIVARTVRILHTLLTLVNKHRNCDKFEVNTQSVAYLAGKKHKIDKINLTTSVSKDLQKDADTVGQSFSWLLAGWRVHSPIPWWWLKFWKFCQKYFFL